MRATTLPRKLSWGRFRCCPDKGASHQVEGGGGGHPVAGGAEIKGVPRAVQPELACGQSAVAQDDVDVIGDAHHFRVGEAFTEQDIF